MIRQVISACANRCCARQTFRVLWACWLFFGSSLCLAAPAGWNQTWGDELDGTVVDGTVVDGTVVDGTVVDGTVVDETKSDRIHGTNPINREQQGYQPSQATVSDGTSVADGDVTYDGVVDRVELAVWQQSVQNRAGVAATLVPQPTCVAFCALLSLIAVSQNCLPRAMLRT